MNQDSKGRPEAADASRPDRCPKCDSPAPHLHPAVQFEGEVQPCSDAFHLRATPQNRGATSTRDEVYAAIDSERAYQRSLERNAVKDQRPMEHLAIITRLCQDMNDW